MPRDNIEIAATRGNDDRAAEGAPEQDGRGPIRVEIMGIDQIEIAAVEDLPAQKWQDRAKQSKRCRAHSDFGQHRIARMIDMQPATDLLPRDPSKNRISPKPPRGKRKPWAGRHHAGLDRAARDQVSQARFDKYPMLGLRYARI